MKGRVIVLIDATKNDLHSSQIKCAVSDTILPQMNARQNPRKLRGIQGGRVRPSMPVVLPQPKGLGHVAEPIP
jgi:hypothetical protein